jgi:dTMP kinase
MFITFEGGEGAGKSSQLKFLSESLQKIGYETILLHEPGGTPLGEIVYSWISDPDSRVLKRLYSRWTTNQDAQDLDPLAELFLFEAARAQLVKQVIKPSLENELIVICDRFSDSTIAYQGYGRGLDIATIQAINNIATDNLKPDLTILLDVPPEIGLKRTRGQNHRMEQQGLAFHKKVQSGYLKIATEEPDRFIIIDALKSIQEINQLVWGHVQKRLTDQKSH